MQFPIFKTKIKGLNKKFDLNNPRERKNYFELKAGEEIKKLREHLKNGNTFIVYLLGKKNSGKGTYAKMFAEIVDPKRIEHFSIGDMIRSIDLELKDKQKKKELIDFLEKNYRGWTSSQDIVASLEKRSTKNLLPTELILLLVKREIAKRPKKTIFIDGFPRDLDQMNFALFFRDLVGYRDDPDVFVLIDVPEKVIDERIKYRRVCPKCQTSRSIKLLPTSIVGYDSKKKEFYLNCDNPVCPGLRHAEADSGLAEAGPRMVPKEGDEKGIGPIKDRLWKDGRLIERAASLYGIPKVFLRNSIPKAVAKNSVDDYEITPEYYYELEGKKVAVKERHWVVKDDAGKPSYSLLPPPVVVSLIRQLTAVLHLS